MKVKAIMTPANKLALINPKESARTAMQKITELGVLSLPVVEGKRFVGFLSKQYVYETFFKECTMGIDVFLDREVSTFIHNRIEPVSPELFIEEAAKIFFENNVRFIPVVNEENEFMGIVTQKVLFQLLTKIYGLSYPKISIATNDVKGGLSKITEIIAKHGGDIKNIAMINTSVKGVDDISIRLVCKNLDSLIEKIEEKGYIVRDFSK